RINKRKDGRENAKQNPLQNTSHQVWDIFTIAQRQVGQALSLPQISRGAGNGRRQQRLPAPRLYSASGSSPVSSGSPPAYCRRVSSSYPGIASSGTSVTGSSTTSSPSIFTRR